MAEEVSELSLDTSGVAAGVEQAVRSFNQFNNSLDTVTATMVKFGAQGDIVSATVKGITDKGNTLTASLKATADGGQTVSVSMKAGADALNEFQQWQQKLDAQGQSLNKTLGDSATSAYAYTAAEQNARAEAEAFAASVKAEQAALDATNKSLAATKALAAGTETLLNGKPLSSLNPNQVTAFNNAMQKAVSYVQNGKVNLSDFEKVLEAVNSGKPMVGLSQDVNAVQSALQQAKSSVEGATSLTNKLLLSWQSVTKIIQAKAIYDSLQLITQGMKEAITGALDYTKQVALIQTISQDANVSSQQWAAGLREVSDSYGVDLADAATAAYDLLSNQVTKGAETFDVLATAQKLAKTTNASTTESVNLLSSAINSFGLSSADAEKLASQFFSVIDLGRVTTGELSQSYGRSAVLAHTLGVSYTELNSSLAVLTQSGIKVNEAYTLINNLFSKLIKPTKGLQQTLADMGYDTAQEAVAGLGLVGVLDKLDQAYQGNTAAIAADFNEIRGFRGAISLTGDGLSKLKDTIDEVTNSTEKYEKAKEIVFKSPGQIFDQEFNRIKTFFVVDIGVTAVSALAKFNEAIGGISTIVKTVIVTLGSAATALGTMYAAMLLFKGFNAFATVIASAYEMITVFGLGEAAAYAFGAAISFTGVPAAIAIVVGALAGLGYYFSSGVDTAQASLNELISDYQKAGNSIVATEQASTQQRIQVIQDGLVQNKAAVLAFANEVKDGLKVALDNSIEYMKSTESAVSSQFKILEGIVSKSITSIEGKISEAQKNIDTATNYIAGLPDQKAAIAFDRALALNKVNVKNFGLEVDQTLEITLSRIEELKNNATKALNTGTSQGLQNYLTNINAAISLYKGLQTEIGSFKIPTASLNKKGGVSSVGSKSSAAVANVDLQGEINTLLDQQEAALKGFIKLQTTAKQNAQDLLAEQRQQLAALKDNYKALNDFTILDKKGNIKSEYLGEDGKKQALDELKSKVLAVMFSLDTLGAGVDSKIKAAESFAQQESSLFAKFGDQYAATAKTLDASNNFENAAKGVTNLSKSFDTAITDVKGLKQAQDVNSASTQKTIVDTQTLIAKIEAAAAKSDSFGTIFKNSLNVTDLGARGLSSDLNKITDILTPLKSKLADLQSGKSKDIGGIVQASKDAIDELGKLNINTSLSGTLIGKLFSARTQSGKAIITPEDGTKPALTLEDAITQLRLKILNLRDLKISGGKLEQDITKLESDTGDLNTQTEKFKKELADLASQSTKEMTTVDGALQKPGDILANLISKNEALIKSFKDNSQALSKVGSDGVNALKGIGGEINNVGIQFGDVTDTFDEHMHQVYLASLEAHAGEIAAFKAEIQAQNDALKAAGEVTYSWNNFKTNLATVFTAAKGYVIDFITTTIKNFPTLFSFAKQGFSQFLTEAQATLSQWGTSTLAAFKYVFGEFPPLIAFVANDISTAFSQAYTAVTNFALSFPIVETAISKVASAIVTIDTTMNAVAQNVSSAITNFIFKALDALDNAIAQIPSLIESVGTTISTTFNSAYTIVSDFITGVLASLGNYFSSILPTSVINAGSAIIKTFGNLYTTVSTFINNYLTPLTNSINNLPTVFNNFGQTATTIYNQISQIITNMIRGFDNVTGAITAISNAVTYVGETISSVFNSAIGVVNSFIAKAESALSFGLGGSSGGSNSEGEGADWFSRGGKVGYFAKGGFMQDFLSGKYARGTDTVPAMLTKGEYVMDAGNTAKFLPLLQAMSTGRLNPRGNSGISNTTNVGDINITVPGASTSDANIKAIASGIRRGIRQGSIKLN